MFEFIFILITFFIIDWVVLKLNFQIVGIKVRLRRISLGALLIVIYNICGRIILPIPVYGLMFITLQSIIVKAIGREVVSWGRAIWSSLLSFFIVSFGVVAFQMPLLLNKDISLFILKKPLGVGLGALFELVGPLVIICFLMTFKTSLIPFSCFKISKSEAWSLYLFGVMVFVSYSIVVIFTMSLEKGSQLFLSILAILTWISLISGFIAFHVIRLLTHKELDSERLSFEEEKGKLINEVQETIRSNEETITAKKLDVTVNEVLHRLQDATLIKTEEFPQGINPKIYLLLNQREITALKLVGLGKQNKEIAAQTFLSEGSVTNMISGLCDKLELESRIHLAVFAFVHGLVTKEELKIKDEIDGKK